MTPPPPSVPRLALSKPEAAASLSMSVDSFERYVVGEIPCVYRGRLRLYAVRDLESWLARSAIRMGEPPPAPVGRTPWWTI